MSDVSVALERIPETARHQVARIDTPSDDEIRRLFRIAEALAQSGVYKDASQAGQAFAKIIVGRDLGLTPAQSMSGLHFVEGQVQMHYRTLGNFVRSNGYHYRFGAHASGEFVPMMPTNQSVTLAFYGPADPETGEREWLGDSTFDDADMTLAHLEAPRGRGESNHVKYPRNMKTARAMSNGVGWYCPEVLRGIPVYTEGEIEADREALQLTAGAGDGAASGLDLGPEVERVIIRAQALGGVPQLADRATVEMTLGRQSPSFVKNWTRAAMAELDRGEQEARERSAADAPDAADAPESDAAEEPIVDGEPVDDLTEAEARALVEHERMVERLDECRHDVEDPSLDDEQRVALAMEIAQLEEDLGDGGIEF